MYIYGYKNGTYTREIIIPEGETIYTSETPIDCTKFTPDADGAPVEIIVEQPVYVEPETIEVFTAANDALYGNSANDTLYAIGNDTLTYGNLA